MIYFIQNKITRNIKIGRSNNPWARLCEMQTGNDCELVLLATAGEDEWEERDLHSKFSEYHLRGEWYRQSAKLDGIIESIKRINTLRGSPDGMFRDSEKPPRERKIKNLTNDWFYRKMMNDVFGI